MSERLTRRDLATLACAGAAAALLPRPADAAPPAVGAEVPGDDLPAREASWYKKLP